MSTPEFKDLFAEHSAQYARARPTYPAALFDYLASVSPRSRLALDVGTGSGQAAVALAERFEQVIALDPSAAQLQNAQAHPRVSYRCAPSHALDAPEGAVDLLTVAQAFHWFDQQRFYAEVRRVAAPNAVLAVWCYGLTRITPEIDAAVFQLYETHLGRYWEPERRLVEEGYANVAFPFSRLEAPRFDMTLRWSLDALVAYLKTWSPLKSYVREHAVDPVGLVLPRLKEAWGDVTEREVAWPLSVHVFRVST